VYVGPSGAAARLRTLAELRREESRHAVANLRQALFTKRRLDWDALTAPREILAKLAAQERFEPLGLKTVPHDLWPASQLPTLTLIDRLTLVLNGFDLTFRPVGEQTIEIIEIEQPVILERRYRRRQAPDRIDRRPSRSGSLEVRWDPAAHELVLRGRVEEHEQFLRGLSCPS
jgi:hypothetical protein